MKPAFAVWTTGFPASGKTTIARTLVRELASCRADVAVLESDALRQVLTSHPTYSDGQRETLFVDCRLEVCLARGPKGIYRRAQSGEASTVPGVQASYQRPEHPDVVVSGTGAATEAACASLHVLERRGYVSREPVSTRS